MAPFQFGIPYTGIIDPNQPPIWFFDNVPSDIADYNNMTFNIITNQPSVYHSPATFFVLPGQVFINLAADNGSLAGQAVTITFLRTVNFQYMTNYKIPISSVMTGITTIANTPLVLYTDSSIITDGTLPNYSGVMLFGITYDTDLEHISFLANGTIYPDGRLSCTWTQALPVSVYPEGQFAIYGPITVTITSITSVSADINWTNADNSTQLQLVIDGMTDNSGIYKPLGTTINLTPSGTGIYTLNSLNPSTTYMCHFINEWGNATSGGGFFNVMTDNYSTAEEPPPPPPPPTVPDDGKLCRFLFLLLCIIFICRVSSGTKVRAHAEVTDHLLLFSLFFLWRCSLQQ
jgi:hypothetical protein